jgi:threonine/homoserine/homoserine lactone efflux protein
MLLQAVLVLMLFWLLGGLGRSTSEALIPVLLSVGVGLALFVAVETWKARHAETADQRDPTARPTDGPSSRITRYGALSA